MKEDIEKDLRGALLNRLDKYKSRKNNYKHKELTKSEAMSIIAGTTTMGTTLGTVVPGLGNAIGALIGTCIGGITVSAIAIDNHIKNNKLKNANDILSLLNNEENITEIEAFFSQIAKIIINERITLFEQFELNKNDITKISKHLARHAFAALKEHLHSNYNTNEDNLVTAVAEGVSECKSKKANTKKWYPLNGHGLFSLNNFARKPSVNENVTIENNNANINENSEKKSSRSLRSSNKY